MGKPIRLGVVFGGRSGEHEVSLVSARSVLDTLDPQKYYLKLSVKRISINYHRP